MNTNLKSALRKVERTSAIYYGAYLTQPEMLELVKLGARLSTNKDQHKRDVERIQEQKKTGKIFARHYSFRVGKELKKLLGP